MDCSKGWYTWGQPLNLVLASHHYCKCLRSWERWTLAGRLYLSRWWMWMASIILFYCCLGSVVLQFSKYWNVTIKSDQHNHTLLVFCTKYFRIGYPVRNKTHNASTAYTCAKLFKWIGKSTLWPKSLEVKSWIQGLRKSKACTVFIATACTNDTQATVQVDHKEWEHSDWLHAVIYFCKFCDCVIICFLMATTFIPVDIGFGS